MVWLLPALVVIEASSPIAAMQSELALVVVIEALGALVEVLAKVFVAPIAAATVPVVSVPLKQ